jgi:hypothetical protein
MYFPIVVTLYMVCPEMLSYAEYSPTLRPSDCSLPSLFHFVAHNTFSLALIHGFHAIESIHLYGEVGMFLEMATDPLAWSTGVASTRFLLNFTWPFFTAGKFSLSA